MQLTLHTDYALRMLLYLALRAKGATISEIAERYNVSRNHLVKIAHALGKKGLIETTRGRAGGLHLAKPAAEINIGAVVRTMEPNFDIVECFDKKRNECVISSACELRRALYEAQRAFLTTLDRYTLADLTANSAQLGALLDKRPRTSARGTGRSRVNH
ncbi:MAG: Rrf2 family transcriptional regulator [Candidatus Hydrogenedentes bacterium]|nr:Rrf2 family transcriptional regulator [Candidatus Hydrogenedentota bacterium]